MKTYKSVSDLIDSGDIKFKLGLAWYPVYRMLPGGENYYSHMMSMDEQFIIIKLNNIYNELLLTPSRDYNVWLSKENYRIIREHIYDDINCNKTEYNYDNISLVVAEYMYNVLTDPKKYKHYPDDIKKIIGESANKVIRNYYKNKLVTIGNETNCLHYIRDYHLLKGIKEPVYYW